ncbi:MAG: 50S ribosomal protein L30 [Methanothrix sp.]|nr:MAG: 50S ribosomal protein L30 [Methanothrix sp.]
MYAIVRLRGGVNTRPGIKDTLKMLRLHRVNHCVVVPETPHYRGMIQKVKDYVAWGLVDEEMLTPMLENRGRLSGNRHLTDQFIREGTSYKTIRDFAAAICEGSASFNDAGVKPVFRLHPPRKGHRGIKKTVQEGGELGFHDAIGNLLRKMR